MRFFAKMPNFLVIAVFVLAVFFGCSDSSPNSYDSNNGKNFQIYQNGNRYNGNGVIRVEVYDTKLREYKYLDVGIVKGGLGTLENPVPRQYFYSLSHAFGVPSGFITPPDAEGFSASYFYVISGNYAYELEPNVMTFLYVSQPSSAKGIEEECQGSSCYAHEYDIDAKSGWNAIYKNWIEAGSKIKYSTSSSETIEWNMYNAGSAYDYGGPYIPEGSFSDPLYCVDHYLEECVYMLYLQENGISCSGWSGVPMNYCPDYYYNYYDDYDDYDDYYY
jgi:hypothetical protein